MKLNGEPFNQAIRSCFASLALLQTWLSAYPLRKEVIQPHLPIRLPCYDFTPVTAPAFDRFYSGFGRERLPWCDGRCVQGPGPYSPQYADLRLLAIPTSCRRVAACNPNWGMLLGFRSGSLLRFPLSIPL